jgi:hypothetical protein
LIVLSGVVYLKSVRQTRSEADSFQRGKTEAALQMQDDRRSADSLSEELITYRAAMGDSLQRRDSLMVAVSESLSQVIAQQMDSIEVLKGNINGQPNSKRIVADAKAMDSTLMLKHKQILDYYTQRFRNLPTDLTAYEKRVATTEIRTETMQKFAISEKELSQIREDASLDY